MSTPLVLYTAAHGGFAKEAVPLGGGAAVFEHLVAEWRRTRPFELRTLTPKDFRSSAHTGRELVRFDEATYAEFSRQFELACTEEILKHDPASTVVLANDVSEGPDFERLGKAGYRIFTIYHVDVVAYVADLYFRGWVQPETTVRWYRRAGSMLPRMARLVWAKQEASVMHSRGLILPSAGMREVMLRCYPECPAERIRVLPWGNWNAVVDREQQARDRAALRAEFGVPDDAPVLLTLSRISPEKGQDRLLESLLEWEAMPGFPAHLWVFLCGDAAFMQGARFLQRLRTLAGRLKKTHVVFPGYVTGNRKRAFFAAADLYVFPSRHESYGLTLIEALSAGLPAVCVDTAGARSVMRPGFGCLVGAAGLTAAIATLLSDRAMRGRMSAAALAFAAEERFEARAGALAGMMMEG